MKNLYLILSFLLLSLSISAQTYFQEDFEGSSLDANNAWVSQVITASASNLDWIHDEFGGNYYAEMNNYNGSGNEVVETWLFSPVVDLSASTKPVLNFDNLKRFAGDDLQVMVSMDFDASAPPALSTWMDITADCTMDADVDSWDYGNSGDVDLTEYKSDKFSLAFRYQGSDANGSLYQIDNISIIEQGTTPVREINALNFELYPNPAVDNFTVEINGQHELVLSDAIGNLIKIIPINHREVIATNDLQQGIYFVRIGSSVQKLFVK